jgi:hypothetical protein
MVMNRYSLLVVLAILAIPSILRSQDFEFKPPAFGAGNEGQVFYYFLPTYDGFSANVNLQIQSFPGSLDEYDTITRQQFELAGITILDSRKSGKELMYEYAGELEGRALHWYARAIKSGNSIYLVTATALNDRWDLESKALIASVQSFRLKSK